MKSRYLIEVSVVCALAMFAFVFACSAQDSTPVKRNSPFSPNPKRKTQTNNPDAKADTAPNEKPDSKTDQTNGTATDLKVAEPISKPAPDSSSKIPNSVDDISGSLDENPIDKSAPKIPREILPTEIYKVGVGDVLLISVQNSPSKDSSYFTVLKDGTIDFPLAGGLSTVAGFTTDEIEQMLAAKITFIDGAKVSARIREYNSHSYRVLGLVDRPGEKFLQREAIPLYVVRAEAITQPRATRVLIKRASSQVETIDLSTQKYEEIFVYPGDIVEFTSADSNEQAADGNLKYVYLSNDFVSGGQKIFHSGLTLTQAIIVAQGLKKPNVRKVSIRRRDSQGLLRTFVHDIKSIKDGKAPDPTLQPGDIIEVGD